MKAIRVLIPLFVGLVFFACSKKGQVVQPTTGESEIALHETTWKLVSFETRDGTVTPIQTSESIRIFFTAGPYFKGSTIVNTFDGPYVSDSRTKTLRIESLGSTRADGGPIERQFYDALRNAIRYRAVSDGNTGKLHIYYGANSDIMNFVAE